MKVNPYSKFVNIKEEGRNKLLHGFQSVNDDDFSLEANKISITSKEKQNNNFNNNP